MKKDFWSMVLAVVLATAVLVGMIPTVCGTLNITAAADVGIATTSANATTTDGYYLPGYGNSTTGGYYTTGTIKSTTTTRTTARTSAVATTTATRLTTGRITSATSPLGDVNADGSTDELFDRDRYYEQNKKIPMPVRELKNNVVTVFSWRDQQSDNCYGGSLPDMRKVYKDAGITTKWYQATHDNYMEALAAVAASGSAPDLVEWNVTKMYPAAISSGLVVPLDGYINWKDHLWDDVRSLTAKYQIDNNIYFSFEFFRIAELLYYDPTIIKAAGLKTPLELWREGNWTLKELQNIADKTVQIDEDGDVIRYGFVPGNVGAITGVEMIEYNHATGYKLNITNSKYETLMNVMYQMGVNGTRSAGFTRPGNVGKGSVVMAMNPSWSMTNELNNARLNGQLEWCVLPKLDENSEHYYNLTMQQTFGLIKGAQNPEGGAYLIELRKWAFLNYPWLETLPFKDTAYTRTYGEKMAVSGSGDQGTLTDAEIAYTTELISQDYAVIANNLWGGWVGSSQFPGITEVVSNGYSWSDVLENKEAVMKAVLKQWKFGHVAGGGGGNGGDGHYWETSSCTAPQTCLVCGKIGDAAPGHTWKYATCTTPKTCTVCGLTEGEAPGHSWQEATCTAPKTCATCGETEGEALPHTYEGDNVCTICGGFDESVFTYTVSGSAATLTRYRGTIWDKLVIPARLGGYRVTCIGDNAFAGCNTVTTVTLPDGVTRIGSRAFADTTIETLNLPNSIVHMEGDAFDESPRLTLYSSCYNSYIMEYGGYYQIAYALAHSWQDATCIRPQTCSICGLTEGEPTGHTWTDASCTLPRHCIICGWATSEALGHGYRAATCTSPATCAFCGDTIGRATGHRYEGGLCADCGEPDPTPADAQLILNEVTAAPGETVQLTLTVASPDPIKSLALYDFSYDAEKLELLSGEWANMGAAIANWNGANQTAVLTFSQSKMLNTTVFTLTFRVKEELTPCDLPVRCSVVAKTIRLGAEVTLPMAVVPGMVKVGVDGDMDGNAVLDSNDAVYLLYHFMLPELYPLTANGDVDGSGEMDSNDAIYLLYYTLLPEEYPIYPK